MHNQTRARIRKSPLEAALAALVICTAAIAQDLPPTPDGAAPLPVAPPPQHWLDRLPRDDRALLDILIGYAPPEQTSDLNWRNSEPRTWDDMRGSVVVIQSWTSRTGAGRAVPNRLHEAQREIDSDDVLFIALHTPDGADTVETYLERRAAPMPVLVDPSGKFCDELGVYRRPVNVILDRTGTVRYAGLRFAAIAEAVKALLAEPWDESTRPASRPEPAYDGSAGFPAFTNDVRSAKDVRGQKAPAFHVAQWMSPQPDASNKVVVIDFWATWCGPCVASIPHTNELAEAFRDDVVCVGISSENESNFSKGMQKLASSKNITPETFKYSIALDPKQTMQRAINNTGIPHVMVISSDWIVRWQGHPAQLDKRSLGQIVAANKAMIGDGGPLRHRWRALKD